MNLIFMHFYSQNYINQHFLHEKWKFFKITKEDRIPTINKIYHFLDFCFPADPLKEVFSEVLLPAKFLSVCRD